MTWLLDAALGRAVRIGRGERGSIVLCTGGAEAPEAWVKENEWRLAVKLESKPGRVVVEAYLPSLDPRARPEEEELEGQGIRGCSPARREVGQGCCARP
ncbi:MAG: hypothetical protein J7L75_05845 [Thermoproteales archaeon]|nr:hypothetical protein [Thermoproteales archaeon]